jgi:hypothetical protein
MIDSKVSVSVSEQDRLQKKKKEKKHHKIITTKKRVHFEKTFKPRLDPLAPRKTPEKQTNTSTVNPIHNTKTGR